MLKLNAPICLISWILIAIAQDLLTIYVGRFLGGMSLGISCAVGPLYVSQVSSDELRGSLATLPWCLCTIGIVIGHVMGTFFEWRFNAFMGALSVIPAFIFLLCSPTEKQMKMYTDKDPVDHLEENRSSGEKDSNGSRITWPRWAFIKAVTYAFTLMGFQQLCGPNAVQYYAVTIFQSAFSSNKNNNTNDLTEGKQSSSTLNANYCSIIIGTILCITSFSSCVLVEKLGRKILANMSLVIMGISSGTLGGYFYIQSLNFDLTGTLSTIIQWVPLTSLIIFVAAYGLGIGSVCYVIVVEILPFEYRTKIFPITSGFNWLCAFIVAKTYPDLVSVVNNYGTFWIYAGVCFAGLIFITVCIPETKGTDEKFVMEFFSSFGSGKLKDDDDDDDDK